jgi:hypothetical protein
MPVTYDRAMIHTFVERLYRRANNAVATYTLLGVGTGLSVGYIVAGLLGEVSRGRMPYEALCIILFGGIAYSVGRDRAFALRVQAQLALCQLRTEENTRLARV